MKKVCLFVLLSANSILSSQAASPVIVIADDGKSALINILDNPNEPKDEWFAGRLFDAMAGITAANTKRVANESMSISCDVATSQPSGARFGNCKIRLKASTGIRISKALNAVDVQLKGEAATTFRGAFVSDVTDTKKFIFGNQYGLLIE